MPGKQFTDLTKASALKDSDIIAVHDGNGLKQSNMEDVTIYMSDKFSNPNLLINPDFKINQRGASSYTSGYTVDRWKSDNATLNASTLVLSNPTDSGATFVQYLENSHTGTFTLTINAASVTGTVKFAWYAENTYHTGKAISKGVNTYTFSASNLTWVGIEMISGASIPLIYMKLEEGTVATPFVAPNYAEELIKCYRFYQIVSLDMAKISFSGKQGFIPFTPKVKMRSTPTIGYRTNKLYMRKSYVDMTLEELAFNSAWASSDTVIGVEFNVSYNRISMLTPIDSHLDKFELDAEIY